MTNYPSWVLDMGDSTLERYFGGATLARAHLYANQGRVEGIQVSGDLVVARVRGNGSAWYQASVICRAGPASLVATCTCPVGRSCKHTAALILTLRDDAHQHLAPDWQRTLMPLLPVASESTGIRLALQFNQTAHGLTIRPLRQGLRDNWIKAQASWSDLQFSMTGELDRAQHEALLALLDARRQTDYGYRIEMLPLNSLYPGMWPLLRQARDVGVAFVSGEELTRQGHTTLVLFDEPFDPSIWVASAHEGLTLTPSVNRGDASYAVGRPQLVGMPAHGVALAPDDSGQLWLAPLSRPLSEAEHRIFAHTPEVRIPPDEVPIFAAGFLPQLRRTFTVRMSPDVNLPEPAPPQLLCRIGFTNRQASVRWGFRYGWDDQPVDLEFTPTHDDPPIRNLMVEAELAASVPHGLWRRDGLRHQVELLPTKLTGRDLLDFTSTVLPELDARSDVVVLRDDNVPDFREALNAPQVELRVNESSDDDWFNLGVDVTIDGQTVPFADLFTALSLGEEFLLLDSGLWFSLDRPELEQLRTLIGEAETLIEREGNTYKLRPEHAGLWDELVSLGVVAEQAASWSAAVNALLNTDALPDVAVPAGLKAELRPYQLTGFRWLAFLWRTRLGGILADEMGLGKTLQALAMAQAAFEAGELTRPILVVAPTSVMGTWVSEAGRFTPGLRVTSITSTQKIRRVPLVEAIGEAQIVVTSYTLLRLEADAYAEQSWSAVLLDEAQFVKNRSSKAYQAVRRLRAQMKVTLTGTPLENNLMDLWSLLSITAPGLFPDPTAFGEVFRKPIESGDNEALTRLQTRTRPLMLRRTKAAVATELPDKQEQIVPVTLSSGHRKIYDRHLARERQKVLGLVDDLNTNRITILRSLTRLRQLSLAPSLVDDSYPATSAKIDTLLEMLDEVRRGGHRALVFSQFTGFLALVKERLDAEQINYEYLDGRTRNRPEVIEAFRSGDAPVFLISLKAGGFGLTLTEADYVFILDPWWNPAAESQAIDRTHRIGQDKPVNVYRLVATDTIEEKVVALQERKRDLFDNVVGTASDMAAPLSAEDIRGLLEG